MLSEARAFYNKVHFILKSCTVTTAASFQRPFIPKVDINARTILLNLKALNSKPHLSD